ncbi:hypothetical protein [Bradyrhizobium sp. sBnM-33]|nr:hypothetical protein [Bradyrhizobium sp. sBnM-33]
MASTCHLPRLNRTAFIAAAAGATVGCAPALAQHAGRGIMVVLR